MDNTELYKSCQIEARHNLTEFLEKPDMALYFVRFKGKRTFNCNGDYTWSEPHSKENILTIIPLTHTRYAITTVGESIWGDGSNSTLNFHKSDIRGFWYDYSMNGRVMTKDKIKEEFGIDLGSGCYGVGPACFEMVKVGLDLCYEYKIPPENITNIFDMCEPPVHKGGLKKFLLDFVFQVTTSDKDGYVSYFRNFKDYERNRRTQQKVGRAFRYMFPSLDNLEVENIVRTYNKIYSKVNYRVVESTEAHEFNFAYSGATTPDRNPVMAGSWKPLSASCMHHDASEFGSDGHPAESYASGDFSIVYTVSEDNRIGSRTVVYLKEGLHGPIYTMDTPAALALEKYLEEKGYKFESYWGGAKMQPQEGFEAGGILRVPYLDGSGNFVVGCDGNVYIDSVPSGVDAGTKYAGQDTAGYLYPSEVCERCGVVVYDGDGYLISDHPEDLRTCDGCGQHVWTEDTNNVIPYYDATCHNGYYYENTEFLECTYSHEVFNADEEDYITLEDGETLLVSYLQNYIDCYGYDDVPEEHRPTGWDDDEETEERVA